MRAGFKMATAGLVLVLGCASCALTPVDSTVSGASMSVEVASQDIQVARASVVSASVDAAALDAYHGIEAGHGDESSQFTHIASHGVKYRDGVYHASGQGWQSSVPVTVTVSHGRIESIAVGQNSEAAAMADKAQDTVVPQIIEGQSAEGIDLATGATHTSQAIVEAVAAALLLATVD